MSDTVSAREIENEIFFADFPCELAGYENLDKYTVRDWLIGHAVQDRWTWKQDDRLIGRLCKAGIEVTVKVVFRGLLLTSGDRESLVETKW